MCLNGSTREAKGMGSKQLRGQHSSIDRSQPLVQGMNLNKIRAYYCMHAKSIHAWGEDLQAQRDQSKTRTVMSEDEGFFVFSFSSSIVAVSPMWPERDLNRTINNNHHPSIGSWSIHNPNPYPHQLLLLCIIFSQIRNQFLLRNDWQPNRANRENNARGWGGHKESSFF